MYNKPVSRLQTIAVCLLILLVVFTPLLETVDFWDNTPGPANDTELNVTAFAAVVGFMFFLATLQKLLVLLFRGKVPIAEAAPRLLAACMPGLYPALFAESVPIPLRI